jgi:hypothetical protein
MSVPESMLKEANVIARIRSILFSSVVYRDKFERGMGMAVLLDKEVVNELEAEIAPYTSLILRANENVPDYNDITSCGIVCVIRNFGIMSRIDCPVVVTAGDILNRKTQTENQEAVCGRKAEEFWGGAKVFRFYVFRI